MPEAGHDAPSTPLPMDPRRAAIGAVVSGVLYWLAFAGKVEVWPLTLLAFVAFVPVLVVLRGQTPRRALWIGALMGLTLSFAGFYWLDPMLRTFGGFPAVVSAMLVVVICAYQGGRFGLMSWLHARAVRRGWPAAPAFVAAFAASEFVYPLLFPWYFGASVHGMPLLTQTAEIAGPIVVGAMLVGVNVAIAEPLVARMGARRADRRVLIAGASGLLGALLYGAVRIPMVQARALASPPLHIGIAQGNMGLLEKRSNFAEGLRRQRALTAGMSAGGVELAVWSESSVMFPVYERDAAAFVIDRVAGGLGVPVIFGGDVWRDTPDHRGLHFNVAFSVDRSGMITGHYAKHHLLAFGEYLPFSAPFPMLRAWSANSGNFTAGTSFDPLVVTTADGVRHRVAALICYEDILPSFTNAAVRATDPELLVNLTNDAWFGDSSEPWEHLALAQFRAIEHRRYLVRSTNSGVSAVVDPVGRVIAASGTFRAERVDASVRWMRGTTPYEVFGDLPWYLVTLAIGVAAFRRRRSTT